MYTGCVTKFSDFLLLKLQQFEREQGHRISLDKFADYLEVSRPLVSYWLSGKFEPSIENIRNIAEKLGLEAYDVLDLPRPDPFVTYASSAASKLKESQKRKIEEQIQKYITANEKESSKS